MGVMGKPCSCAHFIKSLQVAQEFILVLQVTQEPASVLQVMCTAFEHAMNSKVLTIKYQHQQTCDTFFTVEPGTMVILVC